MNKSPINPKSKKIVYQKGRMCIKTSDTEKECNLMVSEYKKLVEDQSSGKINFTIIYSTFLKLSIKKEYQVIDILFLLVKKEIEKILQSTELQTASCVDKFISDIKKCETLIEKTQYPLVNNISRFDKEAIPKINSFNHKLLILDYLKSSNILLKLKEFVIFKEDNYSDETTFKIIHLIKDLGAKETFNEIVEFNLNRIIKQFEESIKGENLEMVSEYINSYNEKIKSVTFQFKILFGESQSLKLRERLITMVFLTQIPRILSNQTFLKQTFETQKFENIALIYKILSGNNDLIKSFRDNFYEFCLNLFLRDLQTPNNIKDGLKYLKYLFEFVKTMQTIFNDSFKKDRRIELKYKETLARIINNNKVKNVGILCGIHINELTLKYFGNFEEIKNKFNEFSILINNINDVEAFYASYHKYLVKRISTFKFDFESEKFLINSLKYNFGGKNNFYLVRILDDKKKSESLFKSFLTKYPKDCEINLFSFNGLSKHDLDYVCKLENYFDNLTSLIIEEYSNIYKNLMTRKLIFSQILSTSLLNFKGKKENYEVLVNFIQASILLKFNSKEKRLSLNDIMKELEVKDIPAFRRMFLILINSKILINETNSDDVSLNDIIRVNLEFESNQKFINLNKFDSNTLSSSTKAENDLKQLENAIESNVNCYLNNKNMIIDTKIVRLLKINKALEQTTLVKLVLNETKEMFPPDIQSIKARYELLIERDFISRELVDEKFIYLKYKA